MKYLPCIVPECNFGISLFAKIYPIMDGHESKDWFFVILFHFKQKGSQNICRYILIIKTQYSSDNKRQSKRNSFGQT